MTLQDVLVEVWRQVLVAELPQVELSGERYRVGTTRGMGLRVVAFRFEDRLVEGIEQNPAKPSRWAILAQSGKKVMQFSSSSRYFANVCDGTVTRYPAWKALRLSD